MAGVDSGFFKFFFAFFTFGLSVIAAVLAIDMFALSKSGEFGKTWRVLIITTVMFALAQVLRMAEMSNDRLAELGLSQIVELAVVMALAYAFYLQRQAFTHAATLRGDDRRKEPRAIQRTGPRSSPVLPPTLPQSQPLPVEETADSIDEKLFDGELEDDDSLAPLGVHDENDIEWSSSRTKQKSSSSPQ